ncbi:MAG: adenosylmethionine--8-amino-7-oxononanoate transaminase [Fusobacterium gastrosuis]|uniref:adenosylmethionine--8-amino-7-oxononanoate transaminase n=1 Tax=Fusobacterium gastrosuis TaxID=1755100 RepID=UPI002A8ABD40|nr:adenosylmethionine--8-amino-7-oxononanoate transaminase [Fusobacterium gastrosuis]
MSNMTELQKKDLKYIFHPCAQMKDFESNPPLVIKKAEGLYLIDEHGKKYMDCISSWWVNLFGHCNPRINKVITEQINTLEHVIFANFAHEPAIELCEELEKVLPKGLNKFLFSDNGSSCIEMALKLSFQYHLQTGNPQKTKFISLQNAYHGETIGALGVGDVDIFTETYRPLIKEGRKVKVPYINENLTADEFKKYEDECFTDLENLVNENHHEIACMIVEPLVQGAAGMMMYSPNYLKRVRELTKKFNIHLIDDEIAMGFGRTGKMFACEHAGIEPDIMCIAKGLSSGYYPIAMVCITTEIFNAFYADYKEGKSFLHSHTYSGNPLGCKIALEILKIFREEQVLNTVNKKGAYLKKQAQKLFKDKPYIKEYRHIGLIGALELKDIAPGERIGRQIYEIALKKGVLIRPIGNIIYFMPPYVITEEEIDTLLKVCLDSIEEFISIKKINLKDALKSDNKKRENLDSPF